MHTQTAHNFSERKPFEELFSYQMSTHATQHCVMCNLLAVSYQLSGDAVRCVKICTTP